jgi:hypothetical protein
MDPGKTSSDENTKVLLAKLEYDHQLARLGLQGTLWAALASLAAIVAIVIAEVWTERYVVQGLEYFATLKCPVPYLSKSFGVQPMRFLSIAAMCICLSACSETPTQQASKLLSKFWNKQAQDEPTGPAGWSGRDRDRRAARQAARAPESQRPR